MKLLKSISLLTAPVLPLVTISCGQHTYYNVDSSFNSKGFNTSHLSGDKLTTTTANKLTITREIKNGDEWKTAKENHFYVIMDFSFKDKSQEIMLHFDESTSHREGYVYSEASNDIFSLQHKVGNNNDTENMESDLLYQLGEHDIDATKFMNNATDDFIIYDKLIVVRQVKMLENQSNDDYYLSVYDDDYHNKNNLIATKSISLNNTLLYKEGDVQKLDFYEV